MAYHPDTPTPLAAVGARFAGTASTAGCSMRPVTDPNCIRRRSHPCSSLTASHTSSKPVPSTIPSSAPINQDRTALTTTVSELAGVGCL